MKSFHFHSSSKFAQGIERQNTIGRIFGNDHDCTPIHAGEPRLRVGHGTIKRGVPLTYTPNGRWQNRSEFPNGRTDITKCLAPKWLEQ